MDITRSRSELNTPRLPKGQSETQDVSDVRKTDYDSGTHLPLGVKTIQDQRQITEPNHVTNRGERPRKIDDVLRMTIVEKLFQQSTQPDQSIKNKKKKKTFNADKVPSSVVDTSSAPQSVITQEPHDIVSDMNDLSVWRDVGELQLEQVDDVLRCAIFYRMRDVTFMEWLYNKLVSCAPFNGIAYGMPSEFNDNPFFTLHDGVPLARKFLALFPIADSLTFCREWVTHNSFSHYRFVNYNSKVCDSLVRDYCGHIPTPDLHSNMLSKAMQLNPKIDRVILQGTVDVAYQYVDLSAFRASTLYGVTKSRVARMTYK